MQTAQPLTLLNRQRGCVSAEGGSLRFTRLVGSQTLGYQDPFLLLEEFRAEPGDDTPSGFPDHPHRGFETLTYLRAGRMLHRDHLGNSGTLEAGGVQWLRAGRGVIHSEQPQRQDGALWGFQLWINLPARCKMSDPGYRDVAAAKVPSWRNPEGVCCRVIAGESAGVPGAVTELAAAPLYLDVTVPAASAFNHPVHPGDQVLLYLYQGSISLAGESVAAGELLQLGAGEQLQLDAGAEGAGFLLLAAQPLDEPMVQYGPFVMNSDAEIQQALLDFRRGQLV